MKGGSVILRLVSLSLKISTLLIYASRLLMEFTESAPVPEICPESVLVKALQESIPEREIPECYVMIVDSSMVIPTPQARNLGVIFDPQLRFEAHIKHISKTCFLSFEKCCLTQTISLLCRHRKTHTCLYYN